MLKGVRMTKTIQVRVDADLKDSIDELYTSLGMDTSTATRVFFKASLDAGGLPFPLVKGANKLASEKTILEAIQFRKSGGEFLTKEQSLARLEAAMKQK